MLHIISTGSTESVLVTPHVQSQLGWLSSKFFLQSPVAQCPRTDLNKRFLANDYHRVKGDPLRSQNHDELKSSMVGPNLPYDF